MILLKFNSYSQAVCQHIIRFINKNKIIHNIKK